MDELERRLTRVLTEVSTTADPSVARLRNPAAVSSVRSGRRSRPLHTAWVAAGASLAVAAVVVGVTVGGPLFNRMNGRQQSSGASPSGGSTATSTAGTPRGKADGVAPLWSLAVADVRQHDVGQLPTGGPVPLPRPYTVDPRLAPDAAGVPTLVTTAGTVQFPDAKSVFLLAERRQGTFVALLGPGHVDVEGMYDVRVVLVEPGNKVRRELFRAQLAEGFAVSPDGTTVAVSVPAGGAGGQSGAGALLVDVESAHVTHRLGGRFPWLVWASDRALLLPGDRSLVWRAPWTGAGEPTTSSGSSTVTVAGGVVTSDKAGCLRRLGEDGKVTEANCGGWTVEGRVSPDGRFVPMEWPAADGSVMRGALDVVENKVRPWPIRGMFPSWLGPGDVLLTQSDVQDSPAVVRCDLTDGNCVRAPDEMNQGTWRGADWIGK